MKSKKIQFSGYHWILLSLILIMLDRITKLWASLSSINKNLFYGIVSFTYTTNTGAGFSILQDNNIILAILALIVLGAMIYFRNEFPKIGFMLIISGLLGNLIDRISYGYVIDFINLKFWPIFNVADSCIFVGVIITVIYLLQSHKSVHAVKRKNVRKTIINRKANYKKRK